MTPQRIVVDGEQHEVEAAPLTIICHQGDMNVRPTNQVLVGPEQTVARARALSDAEWQLCGSHDGFLTLYRKVWGDSPFPINRDEANLGQLHVTGLIFMIIECIRDGKVPFIQLPETHLHPRQQTGLADLMIFFTGGKQS